METSYFCLPTALDQLRFVLSKINKLSPEITSLNLEHSDFSQFSLDLISIIFSAIPLHVRHLKLSHCRLEHLPDLGDFFACLPGHLLSLDLSWNGLCYLTAEAISHLPNQLTQLNLSLNEFNACFDLQLFENLLQMLKKLPNSLKVLDFSGNNLSDFSHWQAINQILAAMPPGLQTLDLSANGLSYFLKEMRDIFSLLPKSLDTLVLAGNGFRDKIFLSADEEEFRQAIRNNNMELQMLLKSIPLQVKNLKLQNIMLSLEPLRLELAFWQNFSNLNSLNKQVHPKIAKHLILIMHQLEKLYDAKEDLASINQVVVDCILVIQGKMALEEFKAKAKHLKQYVSPIWNYLGILMLAVAAILCWQGFYIGGALSLLSAGGLFYKGRSIGLYSCAQQMSVCLAENSLITR